MTGETSRRRRSRRDRPGSLSNRWEKDGDFWLNNLFPRAQLGESDDERIRMTFLVVVGVGQK